jgi:hypothetical protein
MSEEVSSSKQMRGKMHFADIFLDFQPQKDHRYVPTASPVSSSEEDSEDAYQVPDDDEELFFLEMSDEGGCSGGKKSKIQQGVNDYAFCPPALAASSTTVWKQQLDDPALTTVQDLAEKATSPVRVVATSTAAGPQKRGAGQPLATSPNNVDTNNKKARKESQRDDPDYAIAAIYW